MYKLNIDNKLIEIMLKSIMTKNVLSVIRVGSSIRENKFRDIDYIIVFKKYNIETQLSLARIKKELKRVLQEHIGEDLWLKIILFKPYTSCIRKPEDTIYIGIHTINTINESIPDVSPSSMILYSWKNESKILYGDNVFNYISKKRYKITPQKIVYDNLGINDMIKILSTKYVLLPTVDYNGYNVNDIIELNGYTKAYFIKYGVKWSIINTLRLTGYKANYLTDNAINKFTTEIFMDETLQDIYYTPLKRIINNLEDYTRITIDSLKKLSDILIKGKSLYVK